MSDHRTERDRSAPAGATRRRGEPVLSAAAVAIALLCGCLLTVAVVPVAGGVGTEQSDAEPDTAAAANESAPGGELARTLVTHEARLGASFEASVLEEDLERSRSDRARARRLAQFEAGLAAALASLQRRHQTAVERLRRGETEAPSVRTDLTRTEAQARGVGELARRADASVESLPENATRAETVHPDDFDRHAESSESIAGNDTEESDGERSRRNGSGSQYLIGHGDGPDASGADEWAQCGHWTRWTDRHDSEESSEPSDCADEPGGSATDDREVGETAWSTTQDARAPGPGFGVWPFGHGEWSATEATAPNEDYTDGSWPDGEFPSGDERDDGQTGGEDAEDVWAGGSSHGDWGDDEAAGDQHGWEPDGAQNGTSEESPWNDWPASDDATFGASDGGQGDADDGTVADDGWHQPDRDGESTGDEPSDDGDEFGGATDGGTEFDAAADDNDGDEFDAATHDGFEDEGFEEADSDFGADGSLSEDGAFGDSSDGGQFGDDTESDDPFGEFEDDSHADESDDADDFGSDGYDGFDGDGYDGFGDDAETDSWYEP